MAFQVDTFSLSLDMKVMIWRIFSGCQITRVHFDYNRHGDTTMKIALRPPGGGPEESYEMQEPFDFAVLRHFAFGVTDKKLVLQGYYA